MGKVDDRISKTYWFQHLPKRMIKTKRSRFSLTPFSVLGAVSNALGEETLINPLCVPNHFNDTSVRSVFNCVEDVDLPTHQSTQVIRWLNAACLAYGLNSCQAFGLNRKDCDIDDGPHEIVHVDYQLDLLELKAADVTEYCAFLEQHTRLSLIDDGENILLKNRHALTKFAQSSVLVPTNPDLGHFKYLKAIVVSGETLQLSMAQIRSALVEAFPGQESKIRDSINPLYVGAVGAAFQARYFTLHLEALKDDENSVSHGGNSGHSELRKIAAISKTIISTNTIQSRPLQIVPAPLLWRLTCDIFAAVHV